MGVLYFNGTVEKKNIYTDGKTTRGSSQVLATINPNQPFLTDSEATQLFILLLDMIFYIVKN